MSGNDVELDGVSISFGDFTAVHATDRDRVEAENRCGVGELVNAGRNQVKAVRGWRGARIGPLGASGNSLTWRASR